MNGRQEREGRERERIYLDHAATSPLRREVWDAMEGTLPHAFNPSSAHEPGRRAHRALEEARRGIAGSLGCDPGEIHFTGGGTQSDNLAVLGFARAHRSESPRIFVSAVEHKAVLEASERAAAEGARVRRIPVDGDGVVRLSWLEEALAEDADAPTLVSVMWANNEVGTVQPIPGIADLAARSGAALHTDAVQAVGKLPVSVRDVPVALLTATAHKLGGPVGIGLLYRRRGVELEPLAYGGSQERGVWPGTQNPIGAVGFAEAVRLAVAEREERAAAWREWRDAVEARVRAAVPDARVHGAGAARRLPHLSSLGLPGCDTGALLVSLDLEGVAASAGSACSSGSSEGSHVLAAMGIGDDDPYATIRFSFGPDTTAEAVERAARTLERAVTRARALSA